MVEKPSDAGGENVRKENEDDGVDGNSGRFL
jgi:hypothetical protein